MKTKIPYIIVSLMFITFAFYAFNSFIYTEKQPALVSKTFSGVVTEVDKEQMMVDGPLVIAFTTDSDGVQVIAVPSMGRNLCVAKEAIVDADNVSVGDIISVRGEIGEDGYIVPCMDESHFLKIGK